MDARSTLKAMGASTKGLTGTDAYAMIVVNKNNADQIAENLGNAIAAALEEIGLAAERFAKKETPVDTGRLRNSITHAISMDEDAVYVGTNVEYGPYIELGTSRYEGRHMLEHAASNHTDYYRRILKKNLSGS
jgi:phage gpG-like protein